MSLPFSLFSRSFLAVFGFFLLSSVAPAESPRSTADLLQEKASYPFTFKDDYGRAVSIEHQPLKVISLAPSITELLCDMGMEDRLLAVTDWCTPTKEGLPSVGRIDTPNVEVILALNPDLVVGTDLTPQNVYNKLAQFGIPGIAVSHKDLNDVISDSASIAHVLGIPEEGEAFVDAMKTSRDAVFAKVATVKAQPARRVILLFDIDGLFSVGKNTWLGDLIESCHAQNMANAAISPWPKLTMEGIIEADPEVILVPDAEDEQSRELLRIKVASLPEDPAWKHITAVKNGRVVILPEGRRYMIPGPGMIVALRGLAQGIYPELFPQP